MFEQILIPTDGTSANCAVETGLDLAARHDAAVHAFYVVETNSSMGQFDLVVERREAIGEEAVELVERRADDRGIAVRKAFRYGAPDEEILGYAADHDIDLIVMGTRGRSGFRRLLHAGSVAERVVRGARIPVVVVGTTSCRPKPSNPIAP